MKKTLMLVVMIASAMWSQAASTYTEIEPFELLNHKWNIVEDQAFLVSVNSDVTGVDSLPEFITRNGKEYPLTGMVKEVYRNNSNVTKVVIPKTMMYIRNNAFDNCSKLDSIVFKDGVDTLWLSHSESESGIFGSNDCLFYECNALKYVYLGRSIGYLDEQMGTDSYSSAPFEKLSAKFDVVVGPQVKNIPDNMFKNSGMKSLEIEKATNLKYIGRKSCLGTKIKELKVPSSVLKIGYMAFSDCDSLTTLVLKENNADNSDPGDPLWFVQEDNMCKTFQHCAKLTYIGVGRNIKYNVQTGKTGINSMTNSAYPSPFYGTGLKWGSILDKVTDVPPLVFQGCQQMVEFKIGKHVKNVGYLPVYKTWLCSIL